MTDTLMIFFDDSVYGYLAIGSS